MPIKIVRFKYTKENNDEFEARVSQLVDAEDWSIVAVLTDKDEGFLAHPVFILRQKVQEQITSVLSVPLEATMIQTQGVKA